MAKLFIFASTNERTNMAGSINSAMALGADEAAARAAVVAAKPNGEFDESKFADWYAYEAAGTGTLPGSATVLFGGKLHGTLLNPVPGR